MWWLLGCSVNVGCFCLFACLFVCFKGGIGERKVACSMILGKAVSFIMLTASDAWELAPEILPLRSPVGLVSNGLESSDQRLLWCGLHEPRRTFLVF